MRAYSQLADLEVLLISIEDKNIRAYAGEAIASYSAGAYRSSIVSIWIAVVFDLYQKFRYLDEQYNDPAARKCIEEIDTIRSDVDKKRISSWERSILDKALNEVKILNETEHEHLERIQKDRHRCAHPVLDQDGFLFQPSPELARIHIRTAIEVLLSQPAVLGKAAVYALLRDVEGENYPDNPEGVEKALVGRHLPMSEKYRVNLFKFSLKKILYLSPENSDPGSNSSDKIINRYTYIFYHLIKEYRREFESIDRNIITDIFSRTREDRYVYVAALLYLEGALWDYIPSYVREKFASYIKDTNFLSPKLYTIHIFPDVRQEMLDNYFQEKFDSVQYLLSRLLDLSRIKHRDPDFIKSIVRFNINVFVDSETPSKSSKNAGNLIQPIIDLMDSDDVIFLLDRILLQEQENIFGDVLSNCTPLMEEVYAKTIGLFPNSQPLWEKFYDSKKNSWKNMEDLGSMINSYPDSQGTKKTYKSMGDVV